MKVLIIHCSYQQKGGEDTVVREELELLQHHGVETSLLLFHNKSDWRTLLQLPFNRSSHRQTKAKLAEVQPDVVHIHNLHFAASPSVLYAVKRSGIPVVMTLHNYRLLCPSAVLFHRGELFTRSLEQRFPWAAVRKGVYHHSRLLTAWLALSQQVHRWLRTWQLPDQYIALTPHARDLFTSSRLGIDENKFTVKSNFSTIRPPAHTPRNGSFLYAGRLTEEKGLHLLMRVFAANRWPLRVAGAGPLEQEVREYSKGFPHIQYLGALGAEEMAAELSAAEALIFPSLWYEGMPLTIVEAFACGTPVIASRLGAMETMITAGFNGLHFEAGSEESLKSALFQWQSLSAEQKETYRHHSRHTYELQYTAERNAAQLLSIYRSLTGAEAAPSMVSVALELNETPVGEF